MPQTQVYLYRWLAENQRITEFLHRRQTDTLLCTYEELATDQAVQVQRTMDRLIAPRNLPQLEYRIAITMGLKSKITSGSSRSRLTTSISDGRRS
ncbi:MAG: hypothetical protein U0231_14505 [Nitrospiraceae bacterium]